MTSELPAATNLRAFLKAWDRDPRPLGDHGEGRPWFDENGVKVTLYAADIRDLLADYDAVLRALEDS